MGMNNPTRAQAFQSSYNLSLVAASKVDDIGDANSDGVIIRASRRSAKLEHEAKSAGLKVEYVAASGVCFAGYRVSAPHPARAARNTAQALTIVAILRAAKIDAMISYAA